MASLLSCFSAYAFRFGAGGYFSPDFPRGAPFILSSWFHFRWGSRPLLALARVAVASLLPWGLCLPCYLGRCVLDGAAHVLDLARVSSARAFPCLYAARVGASSTDVRRKHLPKRGDNGLGAGPLFMSNFPQLSFVRAA